MSEVLVPTEVTGKRLAEIVDDANRPVPANTTGIVRVRYDGEHIVADSRRLGGCDAQEKRKRSLALASALETSLLNTWNAKPEDFTKGQFLYR